jgi:hypothetical protein
MGLIKLLSAAVLMINSVFGSSIPTLSTNKYSIDFNGASGGFKLQSNSDNVFYNMRYGWLTETPTNKLNLDFQTFDYGSNNNFTYVNTELIDGSFHIHIKNELWKINNEYINEKNQTVLVDKDVMKLTVMMYGWNFLNINNELTLDFTISNNIGSVITSIDNSTIKLKEFDFKFEEIAIVDNIEKQVKFYTLGNKYYLVFPSFSNDLFYDPTIFYSQSSANSNIILLPNLFALFLIYFNMYFMFKN